MFNITSILTKYGATLVASIPIRAGHQEFQKDPTQAKI
jgi:hypothetical protein